MDGRFDHLIATTAGSGFVLAFIEAGSMYQAAVYGLIGGACGYIARWVMGFIVRKISSKINNSKSTK